MKRYFLSILSRSRVFLTPIAAPSIMGLFGFMIAVAGSTGQPPAWRETGTLPATPVSRPPAGCGMVKVSVPEATAWPASPTRP